MVNLSGSVGIGVQSGRPAELPVRDDSGSASGGHQRQSVVGEGRVPGGARQPQSPVEGKSVRRRRSVDDQYHKEHAGDPVSSGVGESDLENAAAEVESENVDARRMSDTAKEASRKRKFSLGVSSQDSDVSEQDLEVLDSLLAGGIAGFPGARGGCSSRSRGIHGGGAGSSGDCAELGTDALFGSISRLISRLKTGDVQDGSVPELLVLGAESEKVAFDAEAENQKALGGAIRSGIAKMRQMVKEQEEKVAEARKKMEESESMSFFSRLLQGVLLVVTAVITIAAFATGVGVVLGAMLVAALVVQTYMFVDAVVAASTEDGLGIAGSIARANGYSVEEARKVDEVVGYVVTAVSLVLAVCTVGATIGPALVKVAIRAILKFVKMMLFTVKRVALRAAARPLVQMAARAITVPLKQTRHVFSVEAARLSSETAANAANAANTAGRVLKSGGQAVALSTSASQTSVEVAGNVYSVEAFRANADATRMQSERELSQTQIDLDKRLRDDVSLSFRTKMDRILGVLSRGLADAAKLKCVASISSTVVI